MMLLRLNNNINNHRHERPLIEEYIQSLPSSMLATDWCLSASEGAYIFVNALSHGRRLDDTPNQSKIHRTQRNSHLMELDYIQDGGKLHNSICVSSV